MNFWEHFEIDKDHLHDTSFSFVKAKTKTRHSCEFCSDHWGTVVRLFKSQSDFENSSFYGGEDIVNGDPKAKIAVWPGKNNVGRDKNSYWLCAPVHPLCGCEIEVEETIHESKEDLEDWYSTLEWD